MVRGRDVSSISSMAPGPHPRRELTPMPHLGVTRPRFGMAAGASPRRPQPRIGFRDDRLSWRRPISSWICLGAMTAGLLAAGACSSAPAEQTPVVTVQTATAARTAISEVVTADAVLYPRSQAAIIPKVTAPVERFYVQRGERVHKGQLLAVLEHGDLAGAASQTKGMYEQAQASYETTKQASVPADLQKAELDVTTSKEALDAQQKVYDDRQMLFKQGALPRRDLDNAGVALAQARSQYEVAKQHLEALKAVTQAQTLKAAEAQLASAKGQYEAAQAQLGYATIRSPIDGVVTDRPFYAGETPPSGTPLLTVMETSTVVARAPVPEEQATPLKVGDAATLSVPGIAEPGARARSSSSARRWTRPARPCRSGSRRRIRTGG